MKYILVLMFTLNVLSTLGQKDTLFIYGPGGPLGPIKESGELFSKQTGIPVKVTAGPEDKWIEDAKENADLIFGGAEYMLTSFSMKHKGIVDSNTRVSLYKRAAGILVRPGNPKNIRSLKDLTKPGIKLIDVNGAGQFGMWEDLAGKQNLIGSIQKNIVKSYPNTAEAIEAWKTETVYDAWIIYASWHYRLKDNTQLIEIPASATVYRGTPIAITTLSDQKDDAKKFISFLQSSTVHAIFKKWGWE